MTQTDSCSWAPVRCVCGVVRWAAHREPAERPITPQRAGSLVLKAVALGMAVVSIILGFLPEPADTGTQATLLSIGLVALAVVAL
jgi:hypothetical protein